MQSISTMSATYAQAAEEKYNMDLYPLISKMCWHSGNRLVAKPTKPFPICKTFDDLCSFGAEHVMDSVNYPNMRTQLELHFTHINDGEPPSETDANLYMKTLYEMVGPFAWIQPIICAYNRLKWFTQMSQPGCFYETTQYKTHWHFMYDRQNDESKLVDAEYLIGQRARIGGYMKKDRALLLHKWLGDRYPNLISTVSSINIEVSPEYEDCSLSFKNRIPMLEECQYNRSVHDKYQNVQLTNENYKTYMLELKHVSITCFSRGMRCDVTNDMLCRDYTGLKHEHLDSNACENIAYFDVMAKNWNDNSEIWTVLLDLLVKTAHI